MIISPKGQTRVLEELYTTHPGASQIKSWQEVFMWWPNMDNDIEAKMKDRLQCQENRKSLPTVSLLPWEWPSKPWTQLHIDHAGPLWGKMLLVIVDSHSKWYQDSPITPYIKWLGREGHTNF